jgi:hypothetical protein
VATLERCGEHGLTRAEPEQVLVAGADQRGGARAVVARWQHPVGEAADHRHRAPGRLALDQLARAGELVRERG